MATILFFIGCLAFFGIPALLTVIYANNEQEQLSTKIKQEFLAKFE
jgi:hypothetical protein